LSAPSRDVDEDGIEQVVSIFHKLNTDRHRQLFQKIKGDLRRDPQGDTQTS